MFKPTARLSAKALGAATALILLCSAPGASAQEFAASGLAPSDQVAFEARARLLRASRDAMAAEFDKRTLQHRSGVIANTDATLRLWQAEAVARQNQQAEDEAQFTIDLKNALAKLDPAAAGGAARPTPAQLRAEATQIERARSKAGVNLQKAATFVAVGQAEFSLLPGNRWVQRFNGAEVRTLKEALGRSETVNFLTLVQENDPDYQITFNFRTNQIRYGFTNEFARITAIGQTVDISNVTQARFASGTLKMRPFSKDAWIETTRGPNPRRFTFVELSRTADRIKLFDTARFVWLEIIPDKMSITYADVANPVPRPLYTITELRAVQFASVAVID